MSSDPDIQAPMLGPINDALDRYTDFGAGCPAMLRAAIRYSLLGPGKRLRPQLVIMGAWACGGTMESALPAACAVEMVHAYSLIHDDLPAMDNDAIRRGQPTCHKAFDEATAILAGDALLARAFEVLARDIQPATVAIECIRALSELAGATALVGGQADDLAQDGIHRLHAIQDRDTAQTSGPPAPDLEMLESIDRRKTGAMFQVALRLGGLVARANANQLNALDEYGQALGLAFQITDDLLDLASDQLAAEKRVGEGRECGKITYPSLVGVEASRRRAAELIRHAVTAVQPFGAAAEPLTKLAHCILDRTQ